MSKDFDKESEKQHTHAQKVALRRRFLDLRKELDPGQRMAADIQICDHVLNLLADLWPGTEQAVEARKETTSTAVHPQVPCVGLYRAFRGEVDLQFAAGNLRKIGWKTAFPVTHTDEHRLSFHHVEEETPWHAGAFGILEPESSANEITLQDIRVLLVPGVAFTADGYRLGYGGGYYDRIFADAGVRATRVGISYGYQIVPTLPHEDHDASMDFVVTEEGVMTCRLSH